ncbi:MAG: hypothetical protein K2W88_15100 [Pararheinheimera sp.]|nr:hypothetical protein [Rheinheimera sp.]
MNTLLLVAEGILDLAAKDSAEENTSSVEAVQRYADACDVALTKGEAEQVMSACKAWLAGTERGELNGTNDYYYTVKKPLLGEEATI